MRRYSMMAAVIGLAAVILLLDSIAGERSYSIGTKRSGLGRLEREFTFRRRGSNSPVLVSGSASAWQDHGRSISTSTGGALAAAGQVPAP